MSNIKNTLVGYVTYQGREGQYTFLLHRITGLGTLLFLTVHILDTATVYFAPQLYSKAIALYRNPIFMLGEIALVFCLTFHGVNGLRIAVFDLFKPAWWGPENAPRSMRITLWIAILLWIPPALVMGYNLIHYALGWI